MPRVDARTGEVYMRIVYDGAPEAGKTTNVTRLGDLVSLRRRGALASPGTTGERTEFFDWLDFAGGVVDGYKVRCQLVSVPGQSALLHRRRYLLDSADAIVFVTDSRPDALPAAAESLATTLTIANKLSGPLPVGFVVQANKQDVEGARSPVEVAAALGLGPTVPVIGSVASEGDGVLRTFALAASLATDRVRALLLSDPDAAGSLETDPAALFARMQAREPVGLPDAFAGARRRVPSPTVGSAVPSSSDWDAFLVEELRVSSGESISRLVPGDEFGCPGSEAVVVEFGLGGDASGPEAAAGPIRGIGVPVDELPESDRLPSGHVWPPVTGRGAIATAMEGDVFVSAEAVEWAPAGSLGLVTSTGWWLHSAPGWTFTRLDEGRSALLDLVRRLSKAALNGPQGRTLALATTPGGYRLWCLTPRLPTVAEFLAAEHAAGGDVAADRVAHRLESLFPGVLRRAASASPDAPPKTLHLAVEELRLVVLDFDASPPDPVAAGPDTLEQLRADAAGRARDRLAFLRWFDHRWTPPAAAAHSPSPRSAP